MIAGIDSNILIYAGIVPNSHQSDPNSTKELSIRAKLLLQKLSQSNTPIILPNICISEILIPVPTSKAGTLITTLNKRFICAPFDLQAAAIAADLWTLHKKIPKDLQYKNRHVMRADSMIIASAKAGGAQVFYSFDAKCISMAKLIMTAKVPEDYDPDDMFLRTDIERGDIAP